MSIKKSIKRGIELKINLSLFLANIRAKA